MENNDINDLIDFDAFPFGKPDEIEEVVPAVEEEEDEEVVDTVEEIEPDTDEEGLKEKLSAYYETLKSYNLLDTGEDFEFDGSEEKLEEAMELTKKNLATQAFTTLWNSLPDDFKPLLQYGYKGGTSLSEYLKAYAPLDIENLDLSQEDDQKKMIREYYKRTSNYDDKRIDKMIKSLENMDSLKEEAEDAKVELAVILQEQQEKLLEDQEKYTEEMEKAKAAKIASLHKTIKDSPYDARKKEEIKNFILSPVKDNGAVTTGFNSVINRIISNENHLLQLADFLLTYKDDKGFDTERFAKQVSTKKVSAIRDMINKMDNGKTPKGKAGKGPDKSFDLSFWNNNF